VDTKARFANPACCKEGGIHVIWLIKGRDRDVEKTGWHMGQETSVAIKFCMFCGTRLTAETPAVSR